MSTRWGIWLTLLLLFGWHIAGLVVVAQGRPLARAEAHIEHLAMAPPLDDPGAPARAGLPDATDVRTLLMVLGVAAGPDAAVALLLVVWVRERRRALS